MPTINYRIQHHKSATKFRFAPVHPNSVRPLARFDKISSAAGVDATRETV